MNGLTLAIGVVTGVLAARTLSPDGRGALAAILIAPNLAPYFFSFGAQRAVSYAVAREPEDAGRILGSWIAILLPASLVSVGILELAVPGLLHAQGAETQHLARLWAATALIAIYGRLSNGMLLGSQRFTLYYLSGLAQPVTIGAGYVALWATGNLTLGSALVCNGVAAVISFAVGALPVVVRCRPARPSAALLRQTAWYGIRAQGSELGLSVNARLDSLIIPGFLGASQVGYYAVAANVSWIVFTVAATMAAVVLPTAVRRNRGTVPIVLASLQFTLVTGVLMGSALAFAVPELVPLMYGGQFRPTVLPLEILIWGTVAYALASVLESGLSALAAPWRASVAQLAGSGVTVVGLVVVLRDGGGIAAVATVSAVAYTAVFLLGLVLFKRKAGIAWTAFLPRRAMARVLFDPELTPLASPAAGGLSLATQRLEGRTPRRLAIGTARSIILVLGAVLAGGLTVLASTVDLGRLAPWTLWWLLAMLCALILARNAASLLTAPAEAGSVRLASSVAAIGAIAAVLLPGAQLLIGSASFRLVPYGLGISNASSSLAAAFSIFAVALVAIWIGETAASRRAARVTSAKDGPAVYAVLVAVALATRLAVGGTSVASRAAQGRGVENLLTWGLPLALSIGILNRHWGSRKLAVTSALLALYLVASGNSRSPLFLVGIAIALRAVGAARATRRPLRSVILLAALAYTAATFAIGVSAWRHDVLIGTPHSLGSSLVAAGADPVANFSSRTQLDSLEGLILSMQVDRHAVGASWTDPTKALINFVPRKLWPNKPEWLGPLVTHRYLNIGGNAGVFLSGPGYAYILYGGVVGVAGFFFALGLVTQLIGRRMRPGSTGALLSAYFCTRFFFGGDAFDLFTVLGLALLLWFVRALVRASSRLAPSKPPQPSLPRVLVRP